VGSRSIAKSWNEKNILKTRCKPSNKNFDCHSNSMKGQASEKGEFVNERKVTRREETMIQGSNIPRESVEKKL